MIRTFVCLLILILAVGHSPAAELNGIPVSELAVRGKSVASLRQGEIVLLPKGLKAIAENVVSEASTLEDYFASAGFDFIGSVGPDAALLAATGNVKVGLPGVVTLDPEAKVERGLRGQKSFEDEVLLVIYASGDGDGVLQVIQENLLGVDITQHSLKEEHSRLGVRVSGANAVASIQALSQRPEVYGIQLGSGARLLNSGARRIVQSATVSTGGETLWARGLRGEGQVIAVLDTGADPLNCYLAESDGSLPPVRIGTDPTPGDSARRKIIVYDMLWSSDDPGDGLPAYESQGHGTAVSGNAMASKVTGGDEFSTSDSVENGVAPAAKLVVQDGGYMTDNCADLPALGCPVIDLADVLDQAVSQGASIHNNSWGDRENFMPQNTYTSVCVDMDDATWRNPEFLIVCAAGNQGSSNDTVGSPSVAKNVISVAGTQNPSFDSIIGFSSTGWAADGRIKPDIAAPASTISSRWDSGATGVHCAVGAIAGTSMSSPITAGSAALVRQYFTEGWYPTGAANASDAIAPSAALLKAVLLNGASPVASEPAPPSRRQGWGRVHLENALHFSGEDQKLIIVDETDFFQNSTDDPYVLTITVSDSPTQLPLDVTLVYTDYPAMVGASPALVNDLDLVVEDEFSTSYLGNVLDGSTGLSQTGGSADAINNVEAVRLEGVAGAYEITVSPETILQSDQGFALVITGNATVVPNASTDVWMMY